MNTDKIKDIILNTQELTQIEKNVAIRNINDYNLKKTKEAEDLILIDLFKDSPKNQIKNILVSTDNLKIYDVMRPECYKKAPFIKCIYKNKANKWVKIDYAFPNIDYVYIFYLEHKYLGNNSQFSIFALKMLGINASTE